MADARVEWALRATQTGTDLLTGAATPGAARADGKRPWSPGPITVPAAVPDGSGYGLRWRGVSATGTAEGWQWVGWVLEAAQTVLKAWPQAFGGALTPRPAWTEDVWSWTGAKSNPLDGPADQVYPEPLRTLVMPNLPPEGEDILPAWKAYFGDRVGNRGTSLPGDKVIIPGYWTYSDNLDAPDHNHDIQIVLGTDTKSGVLRSTHEDLSASQLPGVKNHANRILGADGMSLRAASPKFRARIETSKVAGRTGLNQQGNTMVLLDPGTTTFQMQDVDLVGARAAGMFLYQATQVWVNRCTSSDSLADAWHITNGSSYILFTDCESHRSGDDGIPAVYYDGSSKGSQSHHIVVVRHLVDTTGHGRGLANIGVPFFYADQIIVVGSAAAGVILDREASTSGTYHGSTTDVLMQRVRTVGCQWNLPPAGQDHGQVFVRNGVDNGEVHAVLEFFELRDAAPNKQRVRGVGIDTAVLDVVMRGFHFTGGRGGDVFGGNNLTRIVREGWVDDSALADEKTPPTVVFNTPGAHSTLTGTLTGFTTDTSAMRNTQAIQFYAGDCGTKDASNVTQTGLASVTVHVGDTLVATLAQSDLDTAGRGHVDLDTTLWANGPARIVLRATDRLGRWRQFTRDVTIQNATPGTRAGLPISGAQGMTIGGGAVGPFDDYATAA